MKYLAGIGKKKLAGPPIDPIDAFFKSIAATVKTFSPYHQNICKSRIFVIVSEVEMTKILEKPSLLIHQNVLLALHMNLGYNETAFVMQILLQLGHQNLRN
jgi:hypothetical protein